MLKVPADPQMRVLDQKGFLRSAPSLAVTDHAQGIQPSFLQCLNEDRSQRPRWREEAVRKFTDACTCANTFWGLKTETVLSMYRLHNMHELSHVTITKQPQDLGTFTVSIFHIRKLRHGKR